MVEMVAHLSKGRAVGVEALVKLPPMAVVTGARPVRPPMAVAAREVTMAATAVLMGLMVRTRRITRRSETVVAVEKALRSSRASPVGTAATAVLPAEEVAVVVLVTKTRLPAVPAAPAVVVRCGYGL